MNNNNDTLEDAQKHNNMVCSGAMDAGRDLEEKVLLVALATLTSPGDETFDESVSALAVMTNMSERLTRRTLRRLIERGLIRPYQRYELLTPLVDRAKKE